MPGIEPKSTAGTIIPLWIIAGAVLLVAVRYTFFPPCCGVPVTTVKMYKLDSVGTQVDTMRLRPDDYADVLFYSSGAVDSTVRVTASSLPAGGLVVIR